jgi:hypothetical protein
MTLDSGLMLAGIGIITLFCGAVAWFMRLQNQLDAKLSLEDHQKICEKHNAEKIAAIGAVSEQIAEYEKSAREERHDLRDKLHALTLKVEVTLVKVELLTKLIPPIKGI